MEAVPRYVFNECTASQSVVRDLFAVGMLALTGCATRTECALMVNCQMGTASKWQRNCGITPLF